MSVREGKRQESNLKYVQDAQKLCTYTFTMCNNPKHFPEQTLANQIKYEALQILCNIRYNLSAYTHNKKDTKSLLNYQLAALGHIDALYALLELAYNDKNYKIGADSIEYWIGLIVSTEDSIHKLGLVPICYLALRSPCWCSACYEGSVSSSGAAAASARATRAPWGRTVRNLTGYGGNPTAILYKSKIDECLTGRNYPASIEGNR